MGATGQQASHLIAFSEFSQQSCPTNSVDILLAILWLQRSLGNAVCLFF